MLTKERTTQEIIEEICAECDLPEITIVLHKPVGYLMMEWAVVVRDMPYKERTKERVCEGMGNATKGCTLDEVLEGVLEELRKNP
jgi:hypothetical protein